MGQHLSDQVLTEMGKIAEKAVGSFAHHLGNRSVIQKQNPKQIPVGTYGSGCTHVNHLGLVTRFQVPQHRGLVEVGQVGHVLALFELGRVHLGDLVALQDLFLKAVIKPMQQITLNHHCSSTHVVADHDCGLLAVVGLQQPLDETAVLFRHPERLFGVVRLHHVGPFGGAFEDRNTVSD